jgi:hypothetical protein
MYPEGDPVNLSTRALARLAGLLYLIVAISGGFAQMGARASVLVTGDAAATAANIRSSADMLRLGLVADVVNIAAFVGVALLLYAVLSPVHRKLSAAFVTFVAISAGIMGIDLVNHAGALIVATDPSFASSMRPDAADSLAALFLDLHGFGYLVAEVFFGLWLLPVGYVVYRSGYFPRVLGMSLMIGFASYMASFGLSITAPGFHSDASVLVAMPAALAELSFMAWLLIRGANVDADRAPLTSTGSRVAEGAAA